MTTQRDYYVEHTVKMTVTELVTAPNAREAIRRARRGHGESIGAEVTDHAPTNWQAHRAGEKDT